ncbi:MAG: hypothetical protein V1746_08040 [bacterium]
MTCGAEVQVECAERLTRIETQLEEVLRRLDGAKEIETRVRALEIWRALLAGGLALLGFLLGLPFLQKLTHLI